MIAIWIVGILFIIIGYVIGVRKIIKMYKYKGEAVGIILDYESSTGTGNQFVRARYKYDVDGTEFIKKSEWLNNGRFCPGKECEIRYEDVYKRQDLRLTERWQKSKIYDSMAVPLGVNAKEDVVYLDLHENFHGPHGLVAGTTGSGKSEILQTYISVSYTHLRKM